MDNAEAYQTKKLALKKWGRKSQRAKAVEELAELIVAIANNDKTNIIEEIADVEIMISSIRMMYNINPDAIDLVKAYKLERLKKRL